MSEWDFPFEPVFRGSIDALTIFANAQPFPIRQDANMLHRTSQRQRDHGMARFMKRGGVIVGLFHAFSLTSGMQ